MILLHLQLALGLVLTTPQIKWFAEGILEAETDIRAGCIKWKRFGCDPGSGKIAEMLRERYGVELVHTSEVDFTTGTMERADAYNFRISQELDSRFGPDAITVLFMEAKRPPPTSLVPWFTVGLGFFWYSLMLYVGRYRGSLAR